MELRAWIQAARPLAHANIAPPILLGQALAVAAGAPFDPALAVLAHGFGALDHLFIVFANDYADREGDAKNDAPTIFSGGSRVLVEGKLAPRALRTAAIGCGGLLLALSSIGLAIDRPLLPVLAALAIVLLLAYSFPPLRLAYRGLGELAQGVGVGVVLPLVGFYAQRGRLDPPSLALVILAALGIASNVATALPDRAADRAVDKRTWVVRLGARRARLVAIALTMAALALVPIAAAPALAVAPAALALSALFVADDVRFVASIGGACGVLQISWAIVLFSR